MATVGRAFLPYRPYLPGWGDLNLVQLVGELNLIHLGGGSEHYSPAEWGN